MTPGHEEALRALRVADRDIVAFVALKNSPEVSLASTCFFAQQAIEKCLKAVSFERGIAVTPIHDLARLALSLQEQGVAAPCSADELRRLNPFAVTFRYDDTDIPLISVTEVEQMVNAMRRWAGEVVK
ncbi:MAG: HEPN domain-containing protein [Nitrosomonadales bacterium]|nr:HEPN domain-containing protein [Nitrosomonadales bacterium]